MNTRILRIAMTAALAATAALAGTATAQSGFPDFQIVGVIDQYRPADKALIVGDRFVRLSPETEVYSGADTYATRQALRRGARVGLVSQRANDGRPVAMEIWLLPDDYQVEER